MSARVAVVVPSYDSIAFLEATLASVRAQSVATELIVVDDGSRDGSADLVERLGVRCVRQANAGPGAARNRGVRETRAEFIAFLDADDLYLPGKLERQLAAFEDPAVVANCTEAWVLRASGRDGRKNGARLAVDRLTFAGLLERNPVVCSTVVVRRDAFDRAGGFDEDRALIATEDYDLWLRLARLGTFGYDPEPSVDYRVHERNLSGSERFLAGVDRIMDKVEARWGDEPGVRSAVRRRRAGLRLDAAYDLVAKRVDRGRARQLLREARELAAVGARGWKIWLRSWF